MHTYIYGGDVMFGFSIMLIIAIILRLIIIGLGIYLVVIITKAILKYLKNNS